MAHAISLDGSRHGGRPGEGVARRTPPTLRHRFTGHNNSQASAEHDSSQREFGVLTTSATQVSSAPLARSESAIRIVRRSIIRLEASRDAEELSQMVPVPLVELEHFDSVLYWRVDGPVLAPVAAAFADGQAPSRYVLHDAFASPVPLERCNDVAAAIRGAHRAAVSHRYLDGSLSHLPGTTTCAVAVVKRGENAIGLLQAAHRNLDVDSLDRELLWGYAEICSAVMQRHAVTRRLNHQNNMIRALLHSVADPGEDPPAFDPAHPNGLTPGDNAGDQKAAEVLAPLTRREREVFQLLLRGAPNLEIARELVITDATVKSHVQSILHKFGVANRSQAIVRYTAAVSGKLNAQVVVAVSP